MPEQRLERTRATLPTGFQFGDGAPLGRETREFFERRKQRCAGEKAAHQHVFERYDAKIDAVMCVCGAGRDECGVFDQPKGLNV